MTILGPQFIHKRQGVVEIRWTRALLESRNFPVTCDPVCTCGAHVIVDLHLMMIRTVVVAELPGQIS